MSEDDNPFASSGSEETNSPVDVLKRAVSSDVAALPMVACNSSPKFYAVLFSKAAFCDKYRVVEGKGVNGEVVRGGDFRREFGRNLLMFELSRRGKDNRMDRVLDTAKALLQQMFEVERKAASKLMGSQ